VGIPEETQDKTFEVFFSKQKAKGVGWRFLVCFGRMKDQSGEKRRLEFRDQVLEGFKIQGDLILLKIFFSTVFL
jgi:hypothetical protein